MQKTNEILNKMSEIWNLNTLCRCCHADGDFKSLKLPYKGENYVEIYDIMLRETLGISISIPRLDASYKICENCIIKLRDATKFKNQVLMCEQKFKMYCENERFYVTQEVKREDDDNNNTFDFDGGLQMATKDLAAVDVKKENPTEEENAGGTFISDPKKIKKGIKRKNNVKKERSTINLDPSLIIQVQSERGVQYSCRECGGCYQTYKQITHHIYLKHATVFECEHCPKKLKSYKIYKRHLQIHSNKEFRCPHCQKNFTSKATLNGHVNSHTKEYSYKCDICQKQFMYKQSLRKHIKRHDGTNKQKLCDLCGKHFNDQSNLNKHIRSVHEKLRLFECEKCGKSYTTKRILRDHLIIHGITADGGTLHKCEICGHLLGCARKMKMHRLKHDNKFMCHVCGQVFYDSTTRKEHVKAAHHKTFPCPICGKIFVTKFSLNRHIDDHKGLKKFTCDVCGMGFSQKSCLERHVFRKHNPEAGFEQDKTKCAICKKSYKNILVHMDGLHKNRVVCDSCGKICADDSALNKHRASKHLGTTFDCDVCGKKYLHKAKLNTHKVKVHNAKNQENDSLNTSQNTSEDLTISLLD